tara:strand:+ start:159 stop:755 length:597 start_codon:yes stop_codon:yes gene_type:complete
MAIDFQIVQQHADMLTYVDKLQKVNAEQLSFYPKQVFEREIQKGRIFLSLLNNEPCGYIYAGALGKDVKCHQVCIQYDARLQKYGACLVDALENYAEGAYSITLRCGFDIDANKFWPKLGYKCVNIVNGGIRRNRKINIWRKELQQDLFPIIEIEPAYGKADASIWRKNKKTGLITQFNRGKGLQDYRAIVLDPKKSP